MPNAIDEILDQQCGPAPASSAASSSAPTDPAPPPLTMGEVREAANEAMGIAEEFFGMLGAFHKRVSEKTGGGRGGPLPR